VKVRIGNCGDKDLLIQRTGGGTTALTPLSFGARISRDYVEFDLGANELLVIRCRGAKDPEGKEIRSPV